MRIYIPTYRRVERQTTFWNLPPNWRERTIFVVDDQDAQGLKELKVEQEGAEILLAPDHRLEARRAFLLDRAAEEKHVQLDDDLRFAYRAYLPPVDGKPKWSLKQSTHPKVDKALRLLERSLDNYVHAGLSPRLGNNRMPVGGKEIARQMTCLAYRPKIVKQVCHLGRIARRQDFDYTLQLLRAGYANYVITDHCVDQTFNAPGGLSEFRTVESANADAELLAALHPGFVRVVEKEYKGGGRGGLMAKRKEVIIQWKKAYNSAPRKHEIV